MARDKDSQWGCQRTSPAHGWYSWGRNSPCGCSHTGSCHGQSGHRRPGAGMGSNNRGSLWIRNRSEETSRWGQRHGLKGHRCPNSLDFRVPLRALSVPIAPPFLDPSLDLQHGPHLGPQEKSPLPPCCHQKGTGEESRPQVVTLKSRKQLIRGCSHRLLEYSLPANSEPSTTGRICGVQKGTRWGVLSHQPPASGYLDTRKRRSPNSPLFLQSRRKSGYHNEHLQMGN